MAQPRAVQTVQPFQPVRRSSPVMMLLQRVRQFVRQHALFRADTRVVVALVGRIGFGRPRGHPARARRRGRGASGRGRALQSSASGRRATRRGVLSLRGALARRAVCRGSRRMSARARGASAGRSRMRRGGRVTSFSSARDGSSTRTSWRLATRATTRPKRFCCGCCAAPARAAWRRCIRGTARLSALSSTVAGWNCGRTSTSGA